MLKKLSYSNFSFHYSDFIYNPLLFKFCPKLQPNIPQTSTSGTHT